MKNYIFLMLTIIGCPSPVHADQNYFVNTTIDEIDDDTTDGICHSAAGRCSLRAAVMQANQLATAEFAIINIPAGIYLLSIPPIDGNDDASGDLNLPAPLVANERTVIRGASAASTIIDGNQTDQVFQIEALRNVLLRDLTIRHGRSRTDGGAIDSDGDLTVFQCVLENNSARYDGGAIESFTALRMLASDQRGAPRIFGVRCDIGAFEFGASAPSLEPIFKNGFEALLPLNPIFPQEKP